MTGEWIRTVIQARRNIRAERDDAGTARAGTGSPACGSRRQRRVRRHHRVEWRILRPASGRDSRPDRTERRRQDHAVQLPLEAVPAERRRHPAGRPQHPEAPTAPDRRNRHRPDLPERGAVSQSLGARQRPGRHPCPHQQRHRQRLAEAAQGPPRRGRNQQARPWHHQLSRPRRRRPCDCFRAAVRHPETRGAGAGAGGRTEDPSARRARRRPQPRGSPCARRPDPPHPRRASCHHPFGRTSHGARDVDRRPRGGAEFRPQARRRNAGPGAVRSGRHQGLSREQGPMTAMLNVRDLRAYYGQVQALHGLEFGLNEGSLTTLLGTNGAGKTTTLRAICNMVRSTGSIEFEGADLIGRSTENIVRLGIAHVPQGRGTFTSMTVEENMQLGAITRKDSAGIVSDIERMYDHFPVLKQRYTQQAGTLSGGEQQMLAVARALMLRPRLMLLDEPSFGLAPLIVRDLFKILGKINREDKVTILVVEQNAQLALELADKAYVIETGRIVMSGSAAEIANNEDVRKSYLGY